ncbi:MAG: S41 family peptidase [Kiloniellaceae bacterium]
MATLTDIADTYYKETRASDLVAAGFANIDKEFDDITFEKNGNSFVAMAGGERAYAFQAGAYGWTASDWAHKVAASLEHIETLRSGLDSPDLSVLVDTFIEGVTESLDKLTRYASLQDAKANRLQWFGEIGAIGISIDDGSSGWEVKGIDDAELLVSQSLQPGDAILDIDGVSVAGLARREVLGLLHGEIGSPIVFTIERAGTTDRISVTLTRRRAGSNRVASLRLGKSTRIIMTGFTDMAVTDLRTALAQNLNSGLGSRSGLILDLRDNPGGLLTAVIDTAKIFMSRERIFATRGRHPDSHQVFEATGGTHVESPPLVVLLDENSAAGSEIVAAALQASHRALVVGTTSYGAGTIQTVLPMPNLGELIITWAEVSAAGNYRLDKRGVMPTVCTGGDVTAEAVLADLRRGASVIDPATRNQDIDPDDDAAVAAFRALCPPRSDGDDISLEVAEAILADPALYAAALAREQQAMQSRTTGN